MQLKQQPQSGLQSLNPFFDDWLDCLRKAQEHFEEKESPKNQAAFCKLMTDLEERRKITASVSKADKKRYRAKPDPEKKPSKPKKIDNNQQSLF